MSCDHEKICLRCRKNFEERPPIDEASKLLCNYCLDCADHLIKKIKQWQPLFQQMKF